MEEIAEEMDNEELPAAMSVRNWQPANNLVVKVSQNDKKLPSQKSSFLQPESVGITAGFGSFVTHEEQKSVVSENRDSKFQKLDNLRETASFL